MSDDRRLGVRLAEFQDHLHIGGRAPDTVYRYGVAVREFDAVVRRQGHPQWQQPWGRPALGQYLRTMADRSLAPSTMSARLGLVGAYARWLHERDPDLVDPDVVPIFSALRRAVTHGEVEITPGSLESPRLRGLVVFDDVTWAEPPDVAGAEPEPEPEPDAAGAEAEAEDEEEDGAEAEDGEAVGAGAEDEETAGADGGEPDDEAIRYLHARAPDRTEPGGRVDVLARIARDAEGGSVTARLKGTRIPPSGTTMYLLISAPAFEMLSDPYVSVHVPQKADSEWVTFSLRAREAGVGQIEIHAMSGGTHLGSVVIQIAVARDAGTATTVDGTDVVAEAETVPGEVTLFVHYDPTGSRPILQYRLFHMGAGSPPTLTLSGLTVDPTEQVERLIGQLGRLAANATTLDPALRMQLLREQGANLWSQFVPEPLQQAIWGVADQMQRLTIVSGRDPVPWELLYPLAPGKPDRGFLVEWAELVRWPTGPGVRKAPATLPFDAVTYVLPSDAPPEAGTEIARLREIDPRLRDGRLVATAPEFLAAIQGADFDVLHLACHNNFAPGASALRIGGQDIETVFLTTSQILETLRPRGPVVFMNACRSAGQVPVYTTIDGWAQGFIRAGAGAFIGTMWLIRDGSARTFAEAFYGHLAGGDTFGLAIRKAREATRQEQGDPTWLAYAAYGNPSATLRREVVP